MHLLKLILVYLITPAMFYPVYFIIINVLDFFLGTQYLLYQGTFGSKTLLLKTVFDDWLASLPVMFGIFYFLIFPSYFMQRKFVPARSWLWLLFGLSVIIMASLLAGFRGLELVAHGIVMLAFMGLYAAVTRFTQHSIA